MTPDELEEVPKRSGVSWTPSEDELLAEHLAGGDEIRVIASALHRSAKAIKARACEMLPDDPQIPKGVDGIGWLRPRMQKGYNWQGALYKGAPPNIVTIQAGEPPDTSRAGEPWDKTRAGEPWDVPEYDRLVGELRSGLSWEDVAKAHRRSTTGVKSRARLTVPPGEDKQPPTRLRELLTDPNYDWQAVLKGNEHGHRLWFAADDAMLRDAWRERTHLPDLAIAIGVTEVDVVNHLIKLGLAETLVEVTNRLGYEDGGTVHDRRKFALDPAFARLTVLVGLDDDGVSEVSIHFHAKDAENIRQSRVTSIKTWHTWTGSITGPYGVSG